MSQVIVINCVTLDGLVQGSGRPEEDTRGGFTLGGWAARSVNDEIQAAVNARHGSGRVASTPRAPELRHDARLLEHPGSPVQRGRNNAPKYVVSTTLREPAPWPNTTLLAGDIPLVVAVYRPLR